MQLTTLTFFSAVFLSLPLYAAFCTSGAPNLVANCGFETGDFTGWTLSGHDSAPGFDGIDYGVDTSDANSGAYGAYLGGFGGVLDLTQSIVTTPGTNYNISFWLAQSPTPFAPYQDSFNLSFGSSSLSALAQVPNMAFTEYSFSAPASSSSTSLTFGFRDDTGFFSIDDVSVIPVAIPEPALGAGTLITSLLSLLLLRQRLVRVTENENPQ